MLKLKITICLTIIKEITIVNILIKKYSRCEHEVLLHNINNYIPVIAFIDRLNNILKSIYI